MSTSQPDMLRTEKNKKKEQKKTEILQGPGNSCIPQLDPAAMNTPAPPQYLYFLLYVYLSQKRVHISNTLSWVKQ